MTTLAEAAQDLVEATQKTETGIAKGEGHSSPAKPRVKPRGPVTYDQAKRTKHTGPSGERAYGSPVTSDADKHNNQHTDSNNR